MVQETKRIYQLISFAILFFCFGNFQKGVFGYSLNVVSYLSRYGYLPPEFENSESAHLISDDSLKSALEDYQTFYGLNVTGVADDATLALMNSPRCGVPDKIWSNSESENYSLTTVDYRWNKNHLTYKIANYSSNRNLQRGDIDRVVAEVVLLWTQYIPLTITKSQGSNVDIYIGFAVGNHGDNRIFDGPGYKLGHGFFPGPGLGGDIHFDDTENWIIGVGSRNKIRFDRVCTHEFGHALGLNHSSIKGVIMYPYEPYDTTFLHLRADDIAGIQAIYGVKVHGRPPRPPKVPQQPNVPPSQPPQAPPRYPSYGYGICNISLYDYTIFTDYDFKTYFISGTKFWQITDTGVVSQQSQTISSKWRNIHGTIHAAFVYRSVTYIFQGSMCYAYRQSKLIPGYPMKISQRFTGFPNYVDAVLVYGTKVYAFKGNQYWGFPSSWGRRYPQLITLKWGNKVPTGITTTVTYTNGRHYFLKGDSYWRYNEVTLNIEYVSYNPYPRSVKSLWLHCS